MCPCSKIYTSFSSTILGEKLEQKKSSIVNNRLSALGSYLKTKGLGCLLNKTWVLIGKDKRKHQKLPDKYIFHNNQNIPSKIPLKIDHKNSSFLIVQISIQI